MWLIWIDAYSKYGGAKHVSSANGLKTVRKLWEIFAMLGDTEQIVSDNGTPFTSREFGEFSNQQWIRQIPLAPYHPATNWEAELVVKVCKRVIRANSDPTSYSAFLTSASKFDTKTEIYRFLQRYRSIPHSTTGRTPLEVLCWQTICTALDLNWPHVQRQVLGFQLRSFCKNIRTVRDRF